tara:strand:- start:12719 stop:13126 length:408 start_codon:yes stop_codon:yes gene_type:complete
MSKLKDVAIVISGKKIPSQSYENLISFFDLMGEGEKFSSLLVARQYDLVGTIPSGFSFKFKDSMLRIVNTFNQSPESIALIMFPPPVNNECPYFINTKILSIEERIDSLSGMLLLIAKKELEAKQSTEELFAYDY